VKQGVDILTRQMAQSAQELNDLARSLAKMVEQYQ
jgi:hypothetical protein